MTTLPLSVIVPVRDGSRYLAMCLQGIRESSVVPAEVIVVDDGSLDDSALVAHTYGSQVIRFAESRGPAAARNAGASAAQQPLLIFLDADVIAHRDTLELAYQAMTDREAPGAVFGAYDETPIAPGIVSQYRNLLHHFTHSTGKPAATTFWAGCGAIHRDLFLQYGGFDEKYKTASVEDIELGNRLWRAGVKIRLIPTIQVCHAKSWTLLNLIRTDIARRAWPWSRLVLRSGSLPNDLNLRWSQRLSALFAWSLLGSLAMATIFPSALWGALAAAAGLAICNRAFWGFLVRKRGLAFALGVFPLHVLYFLYSSATFAAAGCIHFFE